MNATLRFSPRRRNLDPRIESRRRLPTILRQGESNERRQSQVSLCGREIGPHSPGRGALVGLFMARSRRKFRRTKTTARSVKSKPKTAAACRTHNKKAVS